ncbi:glutathione S-transferase [Cryomyces antarcticus]
MSAPNDIILFHYPFSPYARRITWYLAFRGIEYAQCLQPPVPPREDLSALGVAYRRIPVMSIGRDIYCNTRLQLRKLEARFSSAPFGNLSNTTDPAAKGLERLLEKWTVDAGIFWRVASLIPLDFPVMKDEKFLKDRESFSGKSWNVDDIARGRPESAAHIVEAFTLLETTLLADGRDWILGSEKPSLADIEAIWPFDWIMELGGLPAESISEKRFPKVFAWVERFRGALKAAKASAPKPVTLKGADAVKYVTGADFVEKEGEVDSHDPLGLKEGTNVQVWPIDSGFNSKDQGRLVKLTLEEVALASQTKVGGKEVHIHMPRWGFRIVEATGGAGAKI